MSCFFYVADTRCAGHSPSVGFSSSATKLSWVADPKLQNRNEKHMISPLRVQIACNANASIALSKVYASRTAWL